MPKGVYVRTKKFYFSEERKVKVSESLKKSVKKGVESPNWMGDNVKERSKYQRAHVWIIRKLGKPGTCENCGSSGLIGKNIHWANISGQYLEDISDWVRLCIVCHFAIDNVTNRGWETRRKNNSYH